MTNALVTGGTSMTQTSAWEEERVWRGYEEEKVAGGGQFYKGYFPYLPL